jgi:hypothetical protein
MAWIAAACTAAGVSKSGSPTLRSKTSSPSALRRLVSLLMATVSDGFRLARFNDRGSGIAGSCWGRKGGRERRRFVGDAGAVNAAQPLGPGEPRR